jgi:Rrf2 family protein
MKITALEEYGLRCMLALAKRWPDKSVTMPELSEMEGLSIPYIGKLMMILKKADLVKAVRGRNGGYILSRPPDQLHLESVFNALGEPIYTSKHCERYTGDSDFCVHGNECNVRHMWQTFNTFIGDVLRNLTLADLMNGNYKHLMDSFRQNSLGAEVSDPSEPLLEGEPKILEKNKQVNTYK